MEGGSDANNATLKQYQAKAEFFLCACLQKNNGYNVAMTPGLFPTLGVNLSLDCVKLSVKLKNLILIRGFALFQ